MSIRVNDVKVAFSPRCIRGWLRDADTSPCESFVNQINVMYEYDGSSPASRPS